MNIPKPHWDVLWEFLSSDKVMNTISRTLMKDIIYIQKENKGNPGIDKEQIEDMLKNKMQHITTVLDFFRSKFQEQLNKDSLQNKSYQWTKFIEIPIWELLKACSEINMEMFESVRQSTLDSVTNIQGALQRPWTQNAPIPNTEFFITEDIRELATIGNLIVWFLEFIMTPLEEMNQIADKEELIKESESHIQDLDEAVKNWSEHQRENLESAIEDLDFLKSIFFTENGSHFWEVLPEILLEKFSQDKEKLWSVIESLKTLWSYSYTVKI